MRVDISRHGRFTGALGAAVALLLVAGVGAAVPRVRQARPSVSPPPARPAGAGSTATAINPVFRPLLPRLKGVTIPVLLPTYLPRQNPAGGLHLSATLDDRGPRSYLINIGFDPACHGATACRFGTVTGGPESDTPTAFDDPRKHQVRLRNGTQALYYPYACGASCGDSTLVFQTAGVTYTVGLKAGSLNDVLAMVNSVAPATAVTATPSPAPTVAPTAGHAIKTVFLIVLENHNWSDIKGSASAPYINHTLLPTGAHAEQYYNPPSNHPSEPNYLWLEAGANFGIHNDDPPATNHQGTAAHLVTLLNNAGLSWKSYQEDITGKTCPLTNSDNGLYDPKHNPQVYFDDVIGKNSPTSSSCIAHERPYTALATDLARNAVARYNFITPNLCDDGHNACAPTNDQVKQTDTWLSHAVPTILGSRAYKNGGALFITWDEGEHNSDGPIGLIVESSDAKVGYANAIHYTHGSTLRTVEEIFGVGPLLGDAAHQTDLRDLFTGFP